MLNALDQRKSVLLFALDLSAAFDTVDHDILLKRLEKRVGIKGQCLSWFVSYLTDRRQAVAVKGVKSTERKLSCGVPQGSVLGPKLFNVYMLPLGDIIRNHSLDYHVYADDTTIYVTFNDKGI